MENKFYVYELKVSGEILPFYIGKGCGDRLTRHLRESSLKFKNFKNNVILKAKSQGKEILIRKLCVDMSEENAFALEKYLIQQLGRRDINTGVLTNHSDGGEGASGKRSKPRTAEHNRKIGDSNKGRKASAETLRKMSESKKGCHYGDEWVRRISDAHKGKIVSESTREKLRIAAANREIVTCPHCGIEANLTLFKRYHGVNCIYNPENDATQLKLGRKNTKISGESNIKAKLTEQDVVEIRRLFSEEGLSKAAISRIYNVRDSTICGIVNRKSWQHVL